MLKSHYLRSCFYLLGVFILFFFEIPLASAQHQYHKKDSIDVFALLAKAERLMEQSAYDAAIQISLNALTVSEHKKFLYGKALAHLQLADIYNRKVFIAPMGYHDTAALKIGLQLKDSFVIALAYCRLGQYFLALDKHKEAFACYEKALQTKFEKDQSKYTGVVYNDIGYLHGQLGDLGKQAEWYIKALKVYEKVHEEWGAAQTLSNLAVTYFETGKIKDAISYIRHAIALREKMRDINGLAISYTDLSQFYLNTDSLDMAIKAQQTGLRYAEESGVKQRLAHCYITMSIIYNRKKNNRTALEYEKKAIPIYEEIGDNNMLARRYIAVAIYLKSLKDSVNAAGYFQKAYDLSVAIRNKYNLRDLHYHKAAFYKDHKDFYNAYEAYKKYISYRDSIITQETKAKIEDIQARYETEKKDKEISQLSAEQRIKQLEIEKQKAIIAGNLLEAAQKENAIRLLEQSKELQDAIIKQRDEQLEKQLLLAKTKEQELLLANKDKKLQEKQLQSHRQLRNAMIGGIVLLLLMGLVLFNRFQLKKKLEQQKALLEIRNHIARDLHDEIGSTLTSINILSKVSQKNLHKDNSKTIGLLNKIAEQSQQMQQSMSDIVWTIKSDNDKVQNMIVRMREYLSHTLEPENIDIHFTADEKLLNHNFTMEQRKDIFLIFKEAVNNAAKYSQCSAVEVNLAQVADGIALQIKDNGKGFNISNTGSSNGLKNMYGRAKALNGRLNIRSAPGTGTDILLHIPAT